MAGLFENSYLSEIYYEMRMIKEVLFHFRSHKEWEIFVRVNDELKHQW